VTVGIDLIEIERIERALERRPRLAERLFTEAERSYAAGRARPGQHLAARFCAKEAVAKALGLEAWSFRDVEVLSGGQAPTVRLSGAAAQRAKALGVRVAVSLSHTRRDAAAVAIAASDPA
jgi:holo-[acyl-carrier protein] synthase